MSTELKNTYDVVVVGSGAAGMSAALTAALRGLTAVVVDAAECFGGSTAYSGGAVWIPNNRHTEAAGVEDSLERARTYLAATVGEGVGEARREAYLRAGPAMVDEFDRSTKWVRWQAIGVPDYRPEAPGGEPRGRALEAAIVDGRLLGADLALLRPPSPAMDVKGLTVTAADFVGLNMASRTWAGRGSAARVVGRFLLSRLRRQRLLGVGQALSARLRLALRDAGVPVILSTPMTGLIEQDGRVVGVRVRGAGGTEREVRAVRGVVLGSGGFAKNQEMRDRYMRRPTEAAWSLAPADHQDGSGILAGLQLGAGVETMESAWGMPTALIPKGPVDRLPLMTLSERGLPGTVVVGGDGERYTNEAKNYDDFWAAMYDADTAGGARTVPSWLVFDQRAKNRYMFITVMPRQPFPRRFYDEGAVYRAGSLPELAESIDVPAGALSRTVEEFNGQARAGKDERYGRGESAYDQFYGDPSLPQANLAPLEWPPFYAIRLYPGDLGTKGGLTVDEHSRVLRVDGSVIEGLYAAGNCSSGVMGSTYPGPGATLGAAMVAGYVAGEHLASADTGPRPAGGADATASRRP